MSLDFKKVFNEGKKLSSPHFVLYSAINGLEDSRLGITISSSNIPLSTRRNRIRRIIRECWRIRKSDYTQKRDIVLIVKKGTEVLNNEIIFKELNYILNKDLS